MAVPGTHSYSTVSVLGTHYGASGHTAADKTWGTYRWCCLCFKANSETTVLRCSHSCELASRVQSLLLFIRVLDMPACLSTVSEKLFAVPVTKVITKVIGYISSYTLGDFPTRQQQQPAPESESTQHSWSAFLAVHSNFTPKFFDLLQIGGL